MLELTIAKRLAAFDLGIELCAPEEKTVVLFGPSGAGKSLTLAAIAGLLTPDTGHIAIGERVLFDSARGINLPPQARRLGLMRQDLALFPHLTVEENIAYGLSHTPRVQACTTVRDLLGLVNLAGMERQRPAELSGGQQQRVALARALAIRPSLLLLDEPFSALDLPTRLQLRAEVQDLQRRLQINLLFVTHDLGEAYQLADSLAVLDHGRVLQLAGPHEVFYKPRTLRVAQVVGMKNILPGVVTSASSIHVGERELEAPAENLPGGSSVYACVRPERITLVRQERRGPPLHNLMEGRLIEEQSDGANATLSYRTEGPRLLPQQAFDLQIDIPLYMYERLNLANQKYWTVAIKPGEIHLITA
jgi:molybdate transport system ATP-binding protein